MRVTILALAFLVWGAPALASETTAVMATVHQFVDGFNDGNTKSALAACAPNASIIDEFPPHEWEGPETCSNWANAYNVNAARQGIAGGFVKLDRPKHVDVTGDRAYVVVPANYTYKQRGKPVAEIGSIFTVVLRKLAGVWRITGWAWAKN